MQTYPLVTIGVPNYNYSNYIVEALNSAINQTYSNIELIIVDDFSDDNSCEVIEDWISKYNGTIKIMFFKNKKNGGLTRVCNQILAEANGKYFQTLDSDDILLPEKIEKQVRLLEAAGNTALIYSNISVINEGGKVTDPDYLARIGYDENNMPEGNIFERLFEFNFVPIPLINTEMAREVGGYDETLQVHDYYLWLKLSERYNVIYLPEKTALYRVHKSSMSNSTQTNPKSVANVLTIKYRYYKMVGDHIKKIIKKNIYFSAAYLYRFNYPSAKYWIRRNAWLNPGLKSIGYYVAINLGIPYSFFEFIKSKLHPARSCHDQ